MSTVLSSAPWSTAGDTVGVKPASDAGAPRRLHRLKSLAWRAMNAWLSWFMVYVNVLLMREKLGRYASLMRGVLLDIGAGNKPYRTFFNVDKYIGVNSLGHYRSHVPSDVRENTDIWIDRTPPLPFADSAFESIVCFQVLAVIDEPARFFAELARLLKPGGHLLLSTDFLYPKWAENDCFRYTDVSLRHFAQTHGFDVLAIESFGGWLTAMHCMIMRHLRDYPQRVHDAPTFARKIGRLILYGGWLLSMPFWAMAGWIIYLADRKVVRDYTFTTNLLLVARRRTNDDALTA